MIAGSIGVDPRPFTLRQLLWMAEGHGRDTWGRISVLCALIANCHRDPKKGRAFKPRDFDPCEHQRGEAIEITPDNIDLLKEAFVGRKGL